MTRLKVHHLREGSLTHQAIAEKTGVSVRSVERILNEEKPPGPDVLRASVQVGRRAPGRPSKVAAYTDRVAALLTEEPSLPGVEVYRRARQWGYTGGRSAMLALVKSVRPPKHKEPIVRFEGLPGEFGQFDFGEGHVRFLGGQRRKVRFFVGRLKYSRYLHVVLTADQKAERLIRSLIACLESFGGAPKEWVFDNPKTIRLSKVGVEPVVFHPYIRDLAADFNILGPYLGPEFVSEGRCLILRGRPGRGKTHLAIALAYRAIQNGFTARFTTASDLIDELSAASKLGRLREATNEFVSPHALVIDEVGYLHHADDAANVLYGVVDRRCIKRKPTVFTTNKPISRWGTYCMTTNSPRPSSTASLNEGPSSTSAAAPTAPKTSTSP